MKKLFLLFCLYMNTCNALILEEVANNKLLESMFTNKTIGYYVGSFDPLHVGHQDVAENILNSHLCDYIIIYPAWGGDKYKNRIDISIRNQMLQTVFKNHPKVFVSNLPPEQMQALLTKVEPNKTINGKTTVTSLFKNTKFVGIIGSDVALEYGIPSNDPTQEAERKKKLSVFLRGVLITEKYKGSTIGSIMAIPTDSFIVVSRKNNEDFSKLNGKISDRSILSILTGKVKDISSTKIREMIAKKEPIDHLVHPDVLKIIQTKQLYQ